MASHLPSRLVQSYRQRLEAIRADITSRVEALYGDVDPADISASYDRFIAESAPIIERGQASTVALAAAFLRSYSALRHGALIDIADEAEPIAGTTVAGTPLPEGMAAFGSMVLGRIRDGAPLDEAMAFGRSLVSGFADKEVTGAADRSIDTAANATGRVTGWEGIVSPDACDPCQANAGLHDIDVEIYRHPNCDCQRIPVIAGG